MTMSLSNYLAADAAADALRRDVREGLAGSPKSLPPKWFYDAKGSDLFDQITRLPEYYPTRAEAAILRTRAADIAAESGADTLVELGSGTSEKTRILLDALNAGGALRRFIPFDVDATVLESAGAAIGSEYPGVEIDAVCGDFEEHLGKIPLVGRRLVIFLGSTIGNLTSGPRAEFLSALSDSLQPGDTLLLGTDLVKDVDRLIQAYDDAAGVTAAFNKNVLAVVNRELSADFDLDAFDHVALWDPGSEWIEMRLRATRAMTVHVRDLDIVAEFAEGEEMRTEISAKFHVAGVRQMLQASAFAPVHTWTDPDDRFALTLATAVEGDEEVTRVA
jgi:L-histidine N-alpha-methyltransferase